MKQLSRVLTSKNETKGLLRNLVIFKLFAILLAIPMVTFAQVTTATVVGTISDPGGSQVPAASVTARNVDTGLTRKVISGEDGFYRIESLPVGNYAIEVTASSGFKKARQGGVVLRVNDTTPE